MGEGALMKVGDLVKHKFSGVGIIVCNDTVKNDGDYLVFFPSVANRLKKTIFARRSFLEVISESR